MRKCEACKNTFTEQSYDNARDLCDACCEKLLKNICPVCGDVAPDRYFERTINGRKAWVPSRGCRPCGNVYPWVRRKTMKGEPKY